MCVIDCFKNPFYFYVDRDEQAKNRFRLKGVCESTDGEFRFPDYGQLSVLIGVSCASLISGNILK